ncbi:hypothetical protein MJO29_009198 [Puccinia striiformis f. sp. tritici]|uniref:hypothetical protein n=1 Tax=Puccinia striiformis f. sp. tritici TaxID=168172 RepID=UPI002008A917|nr:hypothetical protein Pst134EA_017994 [Puccinia striiformis f. sp. tritici]KAH9461709.1 hypothetical protein Pst134EA_017994 [Puccinia striiformis f. sp. tritici]KAI7950524.1 hypothetical protein MJO29_009198 [Puccinia striiformis f. sp. tritici]
MYTPAHTLCLYLASAFSCSFSQLITQLLHLLPKMAPIYVLDKNYLAITFLISLAIQSLAFIVSYTLQFDKITDFSGGSNFFILALITLIYGQTFESRNWIASLAVMFWSIRLAGFLLFRVLKRGKDDRFDEMRSNFFRFGAFWTFQLFWVWIVSMPVTVLNSPNISATSEDQIPFGSGSDVVGLIFFIIGVLFETVGDIQKFQWKAKSKAQNGLPVCRAGVWKWSRHPNYFGEILLWWGIWLMTIESANNPGVNGPSRSLLHATVISPIFITVLLLFLSGLPTAEKPVQQGVFVKSYKSKLDKNVPLSSQVEEGVETQDEEDLWQEYQVYLNQTSILFPIPSKLYQSIPQSIKTTLLLDWSIYRFNENSPEAQKLIQDISEDHSS